MGKCTMRWMKGGEIIWEEGVCQVCNVMHDVHEASNLSDREMVIMMIDVKMDAEVEL